MRSTSLLHSWWVHFNSLHIVQLVANSPAPPQSNATVTLQCCVVAEGLHECLFVKGSLAVCSAGLPGEASAAWSPLLHQTAGQEMCSAPQHTGTILFAPPVFLYYCRPRCSTTNECLLYSDPFFFPVYLSGTVQVVIFVSFGLFLIIKPHCRRSVGTRLHTLVSCHSSSHSSC